MLPFEYATGDWILSLDDDESIESSFDALIPRLLTDSYATHYWFPRKWLISLNPCEYLHAERWFPDWQLRLFRNDRALVWKPEKPHSGYCVLGQGYHEGGVSILHFEPLLCRGQDREMKRKLYREMGASDQADAMYSHGPDTPRGSATLRSATIERARAPKRTLHRTIHEPTLSSKR